MGPSVTQPLESAWPRMHALLFSPFNLNKWLGLGFCAFLAELGTGGGGFFNYVGRAPFPRMPGPRPRGPTFPPGFPGFPGVPGVPGVPGGPTPAPSSAGPDVALIVVFVLIGIVVVAGLTVLLAWLRSRGAFMFIDGIVKNRGDVVAPWKEFAPQAHSLFLAQLALTGAWFAVAILISLLVGAIAWPDLRAGTFGTPATIGTIIGILFGVPFLLAGAAVALLLNDFIVPAMYVSRDTVLPAWHRVRDGVVRPYGLKLVLYYLMRLLLGIAASVAATVALCCTCCVAAIPYVGTVICLPIFVFLACYRLHFAQQFGPAFDVFAYEPDRPECRACGYDLRGTPPGAPCPECGAARTRPPVPGAPGVPGLPGFPGV